MKKNDDFSIALNSRFVNVFRKIFLGKFDYKEPDGDGRDFPFLSVQDDRHELKITPPDTDTANIIKRPSTVQILDFVLMLSYRQGKSVIFSVDDYMRARGLTNKKEARKQLLNTLQALNHCEIEYSRWVGTKQDWQQVLEYETDSEKWHIITGTHNLGMGTVQVDLSETFYRLIRSKRDGTHAFKYPLQALKLNLRNTATSYIVAVLLALNYNKFKQYTDGDKQSGHGYTNSNRVRVARFLTLLDLPSVETVRETQHRHYKKYIQKPFEDILHTLEFLKWQYVDGCGKCCEIKTFEDFIRSRIEYDFS